MRRSLRTTATRVRAVLLCLSILTGGCRRSALDAGAEAGVVIAERVTEGVKVTNSTPAGLAYVVVNAGWLGLIGQCDDPGPACVRLPAGASVVVHEGEFYGMSPEATDVEVRTWRVHSAKTGAERIEHVATLKIRL